MVDDNCARHLGIGNASTIVGLGGSKFATNIWRPPYLKVNCHAPWFGSKHATTVKLFSFDDMWNGYRFVASVRKEVPSYDQPVFVKDAMRVLVERGGPCVYFWKRVRYSWRRRCFAQLLETFNPAWYFFCGHCDILLRRTCNKSTRKAGKVKAKQS